MKTTSTKKTEDLLLKKAPVWLMIILSIISMGFYMGIWMLNRKKDVQQLNSVNHVPFYLWSISTILLIVFFFLNVFRHFIFTDIGYLYVESFDIIFSFFFVGLLYYTVFRMRELIESTSSIKYNQFLLFFFHIFYIQYKVNQNAIVEAK
ncbi:MULTISPECIES: hypothetical protein [Sporosarcina]|uniref:DUF4234 domain-containing protein n=1 Tax=Sporosarcina contaminans TaxID=633403 RepID=A0ABW3TVY9_9BACL